MRGSSLAGAASQRIRGAPLSSVACVARAITALVGAMQLRPEALRFVLAQGLPAVIDVAGASMAPTIEMGAKVDVIGLPEAAAVDVGDIILVATADAAVLLLHRAMCVFEERGKRFVIHQGDAPGSTFGTCRRADVLARMTSFVGGDEARVDGAV